MANKNIKTRVFQEIDSAVGDMATVTQGTVLGDSKTPYVTIWRITQLYGDTITSYSEGEAYFQVDIYNDYEQDNDDIKDHIIAAIKRIGAIHISISDSYEPERKLSLSRIEFTILY